MIYQEFLPIKQLQGVVDSYWLFEVTEGKKIEFPLQHETLPDNNVSIVLIKRPYYQGVRLLGPRTKKFQQVVVPNSIFLGIKLLPWITFQPVLFDKSEIINSTTEASPLLAEHFSDNVKNLSSLESFELQPIENKLLTLLKGFELQQDDLVKYICFELAKGNSIAKITGTIPVSIRVIQKRFKSITGITMRQYASNIRQRKLWIDLLKNEDSKLDVILRHQYYDQAHFINDFKKKMQRSHANYEAYLLSINITLS